MLVINVNKKEVSRMILGGLSEKEVEEISKKLTDEGIRFSIKQDEDIARSNAHSLQNNLRHLNSPSISTHILSIHIDSNDYEKRSESLKEFLNRYHISQDVPPDMEQKGGSVQETHSEILKGNHRLIGHAFFHQVLLFIGALAIYALFKFIF